MSWDCFVFPQNSFLKIMKEIFPFSSRNVTPKILPFLGITNIKRHVESPEFIPCIIVIGKIFIKAFNIDTDVDGN